MQQDSLPKNVTPLKPEQTFRFSCHAKTDCFTHCCRMLELALTPYDLLRMRLGTGLSSQELLERYIIIEQEPGEPFPRFYLTMVDDGKASCVFVAREGCTIYPHRPGACRTYPLGRGVRYLDTGDISEQYVLIRESHCHGFHEDRTLDIDSYIREQGLQEYYRSNDRLAAILQHQAIRSGYIPTREQVELFILALYNLDRFRDRLTEGKLRKYLPAPVHNVPEDDEQLLEYGMDFIYKLLFSNFPLRHL